ncbi:MAG: RelA/SpoT family protein [Desulfomonilia bacterium]|uniref:GTP pyrophosphokinase n=1 Tax=anaerobic digester metagenome TaxID=1263854 RepID=A0A485M5G4_9ZZZZ|nr:bifunctional (p)ppGpp synthetase/guanosine-3',5'-bis(diphosphate) 3'-pyrophosphohydrolase [Pseudomonadota bacterium]HON37900.1 bifunctional (p)ppGpp synthetase/guanosine-3',5'-bis(diphosphate) 3'-pyrophosphohydrolase [Deltaproteobacteria bacterium]HPD22337.1 bifunctional (p)ppGpp synthetase/guanosine-3',5'-bis(diphosphate) 3'-pyrophosphohydrolase [Deltaproteobacteria bacterium]HPX18206.1 bifunctional (p)ppGpp synthetase/guanosine-3',5'-bis(diphosphate) 3'-pyrophosphohydrolase [Deltaproteobact
MTVRINDILEEVSGYIPDADTRIIEKAYVFSARVHQGQTRLSGEPYLNHPLEVAYLIAQMHLDVTAVAAALLHDTIEDSLTKVEDIAAGFGDEVAQVVDGLTKISKIDFRSEEEQQAENFRKMILAMSKDLRILLIKLVDRLHNMRTLQYHKPKSQERIARETLEIYAPLANRLGIHWLQIELEELSLKYLDPTGYKTLKARLEDIEKAKEAYLSDVMGQIRSKLESMGIKAEVKGRIKHVYSVYQKLKKQGIPFEDVYDVMGMRIIVSSVAECYETLGIIHSIWKPIQSRIKDFIAMPKANMYQSLHTTVFGPGGDRIEIQIRTREMDYIANEGIAAHWRYKDGMQISDHEGERLSWLRQLLEWQKELKDPHEFLQSVKIDLYPEDVYVFTPKGEVKRFPVGATPLDFAYSVHTQLGNQCMGAKVNGKIVPLRYKLNSGDVVEILRSSKQHPGKDWLRIAKTSRAKTKIKAWLRAQENEQSIALGREILEKRIKSLHLGKEVDYEAMAKDFSFPDTDAFFMAIGFGRLSVNQVINRIAPEEQKKEPKRQIRKKSQDSSGIVVKGVENLLVRYAKCCRPIPGDEVVGFITRGRGITVHRSSCPYVMEIDPRRLIAVEWDKNFSENHEIDFSVMCADKPGMLGSITAAIGTRNINIISMKAYPVANGSAMCVFRVTVKSLSELKDLFGDIRRLKGVERIERQ